MRMYYGVVGAIMVAVAAWSAAGANAATGGDIAYLSAQRILSESTEAKAGNARLETLRQKKATELAAKQKTLEVTHLQLVQVGGLFSASKRARFQAEEERQRADLKRATEQAQADFQALQRQIQAELKKHLSAVLAAFAKDRRLRLVLNADTAVIWAAPGTDITAEVLAKLNAKEEKPAP
jgi:Skp family chaperone for outer membrane proteins